MGFISTLGTILFFLGLCRICKGSEQENCTNVDRHFWRFGDIFSVPGDVAMLNSSLVSPKLFNFTHVPYNISWYNLKTGQELNNETGRLLVHRENVWFLNVTLADTGEYETILRTPSHCYRQVTNLTVEEPDAGECARPRRAKQNMTSGVTNKLSCPLMDYIEKLNSYDIRSSITWHKGCQRIEDGTGMFTYLENYLKIDRVTSENSGTYTCTVTFTLGGVSGSVSETIDTMVIGRYSLVPQVREPASEIIKAPMGSNFTKQCLVFVPSVGEPEVDVFWVVRGRLISSHLPSDRVYTTEKQTLRWEDSPIKGAWLERLLIISELKTEDYYLNYTCRAFSARGNPMGYFTLLPTDPNVMVPIASTLCSLALLFIIGVIILYSFKVDIVLWFRMSFPVFYTDKDSDGKLYDAYVAYPQKSAFGFSKDVEMFALHTLPEVLEKACGYKLFIVGRDCLPGEAIVDSVEENIQASRRMFLLYTASTFTRKRPTSSTSSNNNNIIMSDGSVDSDNTDSQRVNSCEVEYPDARQQLERVAAMHRALLEGTLKVILVELEEISPSQLEQFPESVRHLRKRQGAVCWWKNKKKTHVWRTCIKKGEDEEKEKGEQNMELSASLSPSSRFWKEMRYHMPVRGKRAAYPEKTALLNL
ncbi:interleukin-1 receptor type 1 isoform X2 [Sphaeramia orbicularis]|uniref:interleukin-1 receptor type 1 isoform X2 n=1 Tax=Sphaeramia orbicularis TaxID=375764 RepID=UPI00117C33D7|nr:interleukin-1 receptor type 1-like isoform X2 [Sphaeramia orbicularis]